MSFYKVINDKEPLIRVITGNLYHEVNTLRTDVEHRMRLVNSPGKSVSLYIPAPISYITDIKSRFLIMLYCDVVSGVESLALQITNIDDITSERNFELAMRLSTDVKSNDQSFYTDLNGFTMHKVRLYFIASKLLPYPPNILIQQVGLFFPVATNFAVTFRDNYMFLK